MSSTPSRPPTQSYVYLDNMTILFRSQHINMTHINAGVYDRDAHAAQALGPEQCPDNLEVLQPHVSMTAFFG